MNYRHIPSTNYTIYQEQHPTIHYTQEEIDAMDDDAELDALNQLWSNFCITYTYEPGSTVKPFTVAGFFPRPKPNTRISPIARFLPGT